jgi:hypothetical protein
MNKLTVTIPGSIRSKKNSKRVYSVGRFKKVLPSKAYGKWECQARGQFIIDHFGFKTITVPCRVQAIIYFKGPKPDLSGCLESIGDCLEGLMWENDGLIESWDGSRLIHCLDNPRVELTVRW